MARNLDDEIDKRVLDWIFICGNWATGASIVTWVTLWFVFGGSAFVDTAYSCKNVVE
jgi:hypothetical protein